MSKLRAACAAALLAVMAWPAAPASADGPIPPDRRIVAEVAGHLAAPADAPLTMPTDVAADSTGQKIYVADGVNDRVVQFDPAGRLTGLITDADGRRLDRPVGLTVDAKDRLWIADTGNARLVVVGGKGELIQTVAVPGTIPTTMPEEPAATADDSPRADPTDVVVTRDGRRTYVVDNDHQRLLVRDNASGDWSALGHRGRALGQFQWPFMICLGPEDFLYVSEAVGGRVQRIAPDRRWGGALGHWGVRVGELYRPKGVAADPRPAPGAEGGRIFVSDSTLGVVQAFGPRGRPLGVLTSAAGEPIRLAHPMGLCLDAAGRLLVVELSANRVTVLRLVPAAEK